MTLVATPTYDAILDGMVAALAPLGLASGGPLRFSKRYAGEKFDAEQFGERGGAGRTPGVFMAFGGERPIKTTIGRRKDKVEASIAAICVNDSRRSRDDRAGLFAIVSAVRKQLGDRRLGLAIQPLRYAGVSAVVENDVVYAWGVRFTTRYWVDYTIDPGTDTFQSAAGQIVYPQAIAAPAAPTIGITGSPSTARYAYDVQALFAGAPSSDWSAWTAITTAPSPLGGGNALAVSWLAVPGATGYRLRRRWAPDGVTTGAVYTGAALTFTDDGTVVADGNVLPERGLNYDGDF